MGVRVLLADGQPLVRAGLRLIVESTPDTGVVGEVSDARTALSATRRLLPDVVLIDASLPGGGVDALAAILEWAAGAGQTVRGVVVSSTAPDDTVVAALRAGASGFLLTDVSPGELRYAIRRVARGGAVITPAVARRLLDRFASRLPPPHTAPGPGLERLTDRERQVLSLVARGLSNAEIADRLVLGEATVKTHVGKVLAKLGLRDRVQAVVHAYESGLVVPGRPPR